MSQHRDTASKSAKAQNEELEKRKNENDGLKKGKGELEKKLGQITGELN